MSGPVTLLDAQGATIDSFATIQGAIDAASAGDIINVAAGTYDENVTIGTNNLTIVGQGDSTIIEGTFKSDNGIANGGVAAFLEAGNPYSPAAGAGVTISATGTELENLNIDSFDYGLSLSDGANGTTLSGVDVSDSLIGLHKVTTAGVDGLTIDDGSFSDGLIGVELDKTTTSGAQDVGNASNVTIDGTSFSDLAYKGIYAETLSDSTINGVTMTNVGQFGAPSTSGTVGTSGNGIDLNLKNGSYSSDTIENFTLTNTGSSNQNVSGASGDQHGGAIVVEARDQGSYASTPAVYTGAVTIENGTINGTSTGIQAGEPGQTNAGPATDVTNVAITNAQADVTNVTGSTMTITLPAGGGSYVAGPTTTGSLVFNESAGADTIGGGAGVDTVQGYGAGATLAFNGTSWTVTDNGVTDTLTGIEKVVIGGVTHDLVDQLGTGVGAYQTIQGAIDAASAGDIINVAAGTYDENVTIGTNNLTIVGQGDSTIIEGTFKSDNGIANGGVAAFLEAGNPYSPAAGAGVTISATGTELENLNIDSFDYGLSLSDGANGTTLSGVDVSDSLIGLHKVTTAGVDGLTIDDGSFSDGLIGVELDKTTTSGAQDVGNASNVTIDGTSFSDLAYKGIYAETLSDSTINGVTMTNVGQFGAPSTSGTVGTSGNGIDLNLKNGSYSSDTIENFTLTNTGSSNQNVSGASGDQHGGAIVVEARDQGSYASTPAVYTGAVTIENGTINGTSTGIQAGEPGQTNAGPATDVTNVAITNAQADVTNVTGSTMTITLPAGGGSYVAGPTTTGSLVFNESAGADTIGGGAGVDTVQGYGAGATLAFNGTSWTVTDNGVTDTLTGIEKVVIGGVTHDLVDQLGTGVGAYQTIQGAIDAASAGDIINVAAGTYDENVTIGTNNLTIVGQGDSTIIEGTFKSDNGIANGGVAAFLEAGNPYSPAAGAGVTISATGTELENLNIDSFDYGLSLSDGANGTTLSGVDVSDSLIGLHKVTTAGVDGLTIDDGSFSDGLIGVELDKTTTSGAQDVGNASNVTIDGTSFSDLAYKGIYAETLSDSTINGVTMTNVGQFGAPSTSGTVGTSGNGIDLNLKNGSYSSDTIENFTLTNTGSSNQNVSGASGDQHGGAIVVEARDQGSYASTPAVYTGAVTIENGTINGTSTGIQAGEPGQTNAGPATDVTNVAITNAQADVTNVTGSTMTITLPAGGGSYVAGPTTTGSLVFNESAGADTIGGGAGVDTVQGYGAGATLAFNGTSWTVTDNGVTDTLTGIEKVVIGGVTHDLVDQLGTGVGAYQTIQGAIDAASAGDIINVAAGTYDENVTIGTNNLTIVGQGDSTIIEGTFKSDNGIANGGVAAFLEAGNPYSPAAGAGVTISATGTELENLNIDSFDYGLSLSDGANGTTLSGVDVSDSLIGLHKVTTAGVDGLTIDDGSFSDGLIGVELDKTTTSGAQDVGNASNVTIDGTSFSDLAYKGIYAETLSDSTINGVTMTNVGQFGAPSTSGTVGTSGNGIDLNLKNGSYSSDTIENFTLTNTGSSNQNVSGASGDQHGGAIVVEARDQGSYASTPAVYTGAVTIENGTINGTSTGIQAGEPGQTNAGPATDVTNVAITNAQADVTNVTGSTMTITLPAGGGSYVAGPTTTGSLVFNESAGADTIGGGAGVDTVQGYGAGATLAFNGTSWTVTDNGVTDTLTGIEKVVIGGVTHDLVDQLGTGVGAYQTIQGAIDAASAGDIINVAAGTYDENVTIGTNNLTIVGQGDSTIIEGTFKSDNGIANGGVAAFLEAGNPYSPAAGAGVTISATGTELENLNIDSFDYGLSLSDGANGTTLSGVDVSDSLIGLHKVTTAGVDGLTIDDGSFSDGLIGVELDKTTTSGAQDVGNASNVTIDGTSFSDLAYKGIYAETLSDSTINGVTMTNVGQFGAPSTSGTVGTSGNGIDLNLKNGSYSSDTIENFTLTNTGSSNQNVSGASGDQHGGAIVVEARDQGSYASTPAVYTGAVTIENGTINGTSTGIQAGEPGQTNAGPATDVTNVAITNAQADVTNVTGSTMTITLPAGGGSYVAGPTTTGSLVFNESAGADTIGGGAGVDTVQGYGAGATLAFNGTSWTVTDNGVTDTLTGIEKVVIGGVTHDLVDQLGTGVGAYQTIQGAIDAASAGDIINVAAGTYDESLNINKAITVVLTSTPDNNLTVDAVAHGAIGFDFAPGTISSPVTIAAGGEIELQGASLVSASYNQATTTETVTTDVGTYVFTDWLTPTGDFTSSVDAATGLLSLTVQQAGAADNPQFNNDTNGDGMADLLWQQDGTGQIAVWDMNGATLANPAYLPDPGPTWTLKTSGDFNGDGKTDMIFEDTSGQIAEWLLNGIGIGSASYLPNPGTANWQVKTTGDFNGDGMSDIALQNTSDGTVAIWEMNGPDIITNGASAVANPGTDWHAITTGDFYGDGKSELAFQKDDGSLAIWGFNDSANGPTLDLSHTAALSASLNPGTAWRLAGTGDFNGDGLSDFVFQNTDGSVAIWEMNGPNLLTPTSAAVVGNPGATWRLDQVGDFNGDGISDLMFQDSQTGLLQLWSMNGLSVASQTTLTNDNPGTAWHPLA